jgi:hypothetical protein
MLSCSACLARLRDLYREQKGEPILKEGRARRFARAQRVVEKALKKRIRREEAKERALKARERDEWWERKGRELWKEAICKGEDPRIQGWEEATRASESWEGPREGRESSIGASENYEVL